MTVAHLMEKSLEFCCMRERNSRTKVIECLQKGYSTVHSNLRYALAQKLCHLLDNENNLHAVYLHGSTVEDNASIASDIDLILHVKEKENKLPARLEKLNKDLLHLYRNLVGEKAVKISRLLDYQVVDDREVRERSGYGAVVNSIFYRPLKIWSKDQE